MNTLTRADDARTWERFGRWGDAIGVCITCRLARVENRTSIFFFFFFFVQHCLEVGQSVCRKHARVPRLGSATHSETIVESPAE